MEAIDWYLSGSINDAHKSSATLGVDNLSAADRSRRLFLDGRGFVEARALKRAFLKDTEVLGPAIIEDAECSTLVLPNWRAALTERGSIVITFEGESLEE